MQSAVIRFKIQKPVEQTEPDLEQENADVTYKNGDNFAGPVARGLRNGEGFYTFKNGDTYAGPFVDGSFDGRGTYTTDGGDIYEGSFLAGQAVGQGMATFMSLPDIQSYEGFWRDSLANGKGKLTFDLGDYYEGNFEAGRFHGKGSMFFINGDAFDGTYVNGVPQGDGQMIFKETNTIQRRRFANGVDRANTTDLKNNTFDIKKKANVNIKEFKQPASGAKFFHPKAAKKVDNSNIISGLLKGIGGAKVARRGKAAVAPKAAKAAKTAKVVTRKKPAASADKPKSQKPGPVVTRKIQKKPTGKQATKAASNPKLGLKKKPAKAQTPADWPEYANTYPNAQKKAPVNHSKIFNEIDSEPSVKRTKSIQDTLDSARSYFLHLERLRAHGFQV